MEIQFPYECPRCGAHGELSVDATSRDEQGEGVEAARRDLRWLRPVMRCPSCGKFPRGGIARVAARVTVPGVALVASSAAWFLYSGKFHLFDLVFATAVVVVGFLVQRARVRRAAQVATIQLAAAIPEVRVLALPAAPTASPPPKPGAPSIPV